MGARVGATGISLTIAFFTTFLGAAFFNRFYYFFGVGFGFLTPFAFTTFFTHTFLIASLTALPAIPVPL